MVYNTFCEDLYSDADARQITEDVRTSLLGLGRTYFCGSFCSIPLANYSNLLTAYVSAASLPATVCK